MNKQRRMRLLIYAKTFIFHSQHRHTTLKINYNWHHIHQYLHQIKYYTNYTLKIKYTNYTQLILHKIIT